MSEHHHHIQDPETENQVEESTTHNQKHSAEGDTTYRNTRTVAGLMLILFGAYLILDNLNVFNINLGRIVATWWPLALVYFGFEQVAKDKPSVRSIWYIILIAAIGYIIMSGIFS